MQTASMRKTLLAGAIGNAIEFYDFIVYAYLAGYFAAQFFPSSDPVAALLASYGAFATGMIMRPVGGIIFGNIGDRIGRKAALQISVLLIAVPTLLIGLMPTYDSIGLWAPVLLIVLRMLQGLSVGGEYSSSIVLLIEQAPRNRRGFVGSFSPMGAFGGLLLGTLVSFLCTTTLGKAVMVDWGWRVPFIASIFLTGIGVAARRSLAQDVLSKDEILKSPVREAFRNYWRPMAAIALANTVTGIVSFIGFVYAVPWVVKESGISTAIALVINMFGLFMVSALSVVGGQVGDHFGRLRTSRLGVLILLLGAWPAFSLLRSGDVVAMMTGGLILAIGQGLFLGPLSASMATLLPKKVRVTGLSFGYSLAVGVFGGFAPLLTEFLTSRFSLHMAPALVIMIGALVSLTTLCLHPLWKHNTGHLPEDDLPVSAQQAS
jgi:MHS family proline/betaine transporter-like MFS transporter